MQGNEFKSVLDEIEVNKNKSCVLEGYRALSNFNAVTASVIEPLQSTTPGRNKDSTWWANAFQEHSDMVQDRSCAPTAPHPDGPLTLAKLKEELRRGLSLKELCCLRRKFAFDHHPDRGAATNRNLSSRNLSIANDLIDQAIQEMSCK